MLAKRPKNARHRSVLIFENEGAQAFGREAKNADQ